LVKWWGFEHDKNSWIPGFRVQGKHEDKDADWADNAKVKGLAD